MADDTLTNIAFFLNVVVLRQTNNVLDMIHFMCAISHIMRELKATRKKQWSYYFFIQPIVWDYCLECSPFITQNKFVIHEK